jgi:hypothetical protein
MYVIGTMKCIAGVYGPPAQLNWIEHQSAVALMEKFHFCHHTYRCMYTVRIRIAWVFNCSCTHRTFRLFWKKPRIDRNWPHRILMWLALCVMPTRWFSTCMRHFMGGSWHNNWYYMAGMCGISATVYDFCITCCYYASAVTLSSENCCAEL